LRATAKAIDSNPHRTSQISQITLKLYNGFTRVEAAPLFELKGTRKLMRTAARLRAIGSGLGSKAPQKAARNYLREMVVPPSWTPEEWDLLAHVVRYHRGVLPAAKHKAFAKLAPEQQKLVSALAGILRLARVLRKCGVSSAVGLRIEKSVDALIVYLPGLEESEQAAARAAAGKYLLESALGRPLILKALPATPKIVELPKRDEPAAESAAASD
jgi:exopolyphosphatase/pppGpp-phosphohydrolase